MTTTHESLSPRRRFASILAAGVALALPVSGLAAAGAIAQEDPLVFDHGHIDAFNIDADDSGNPVLNLKEDVTGNHVRHAPEDVILHVKEDALRELPAAAGIPEDLHGQSVYYLPLTQDHNLIWPGWDSQGLQATDWDTVDINIESVDGPGEVFLWSTGSFGDLRYLLNDEQTQLPGTIHQSFFAHVHANWAFTAPGEYSFEVNAQAHTAAGEASPVTETHTYTFTVGDFEDVAPSVMISGLAHHYHQGSPIQLTANLDPAVDGATFEWLVQRVDQDAPVAIEGQDGPEFEISAEQALHGAEVSVRVLDAEGSEIAAAESVVIDVDDHGAAPFNEVTLSGALGHYHSGDTAELTASVEPTSVLDRWAWEVQTAGSDEWVAVEGENGAAYSFGVTESLNGAQVRAALTYDNGEVYVASEPVTIVVDDHHGEEPVETSLTIEGLRDHYHSGDELSLTAVQDPETDEDHYHWYIQREGAEGFEVIPDQGTANLSYTLTEDDNNARVIARLFGHDHEVIAESAPGTIVIDDHHGEEPVETELTIDGLQEEYEVGDTATLTARQDPETDENHYHWFIQRDGDTEYSVIDGALTDVLEYEVTETDAGAQIIARLYDHDHALIAESAAVVLTLAEEAPGDEEPGDDEPGDDESGEDDPGNDHGDGDNDEQDGNTLPRTGAELAPVVLLAALMLAAGAAVLIARRRLIGDEE